MIPELEKPKITEIKVRMDCNGCVQKIKKALYGINGIYDLYIDFPQQKLTIIGWADPERIMKAIKKTRKIATICSDSEQTDPHAAQPTELPPHHGGEAANPPSIEATPPSHEVVVVGGPHGHSSHTEVTPGHVVAHETHSGPHSDPTNGASQHPAQPYDAGQVHVTHHQPPEHGHVVHHQAPEHGHVVHHQPPEHGHVVHHQPPEHGHVVHHQPPEHGYVSHHHQPERGHVVHHYQPEHGHVVHHQPPEHGHVVHHQPPEHGHVFHRQQPYEHGHVVHHHGSGNSYHNSQGVAREAPTTAAAPVTVTHSYNTYKPSPYVTEYVRPLTSQKPSPYASEYEYIRTPPQPTHYSPRMDHRYSEEYNTGTSSNNGNITSIFSDENPNACSLM